MLPAIWQIVIIKVFFIISLNFLFIHIVYGLCRPIRYLRTNFGDAILGNASRRHSMTLFYSVVLFYDAVLWSPLHEAILGRFCITLTVGSSEDLLASRLTQTVWATIQMQFKQSELQERCPIYKSRLCNRSVLFKRLAFETNWHIAGSLSFPRIRFLLLISSKLPFTRSAALQQGWSL